MLTLLLLLQAAAVSNVADCAPVADVPARARTLQCEGGQLAAGGDWAAAAARFEDGAQATPGVAGADLWAQAGNAWLAAGQFDRARTALDRALASEADLSDFVLGEIRLDRARAAVGLGALAAARTDIDIATLKVPDDPLGWLLSATLARRMQDLPRAKADIGQALRRAPDDPSVQLEAGNIAAAGGDEAGAKTAWAEVIRLRPESPQAKAAEAALAQFD